MSQVHLQLSIQPTAIVSKLFDHDSFFLCTLYNMNVLYHKSLKVTDLCCNVYMFDIGVELLVGIGMALVGTVLVVIVLVQVH